MLTMNDIMNVSDSFIHLEEFVDRTVETNQFQTLVDKRYEERDAHTRIIAFYGPAGIGKTMLLDRLEFECIRMKVPYSRINFEVGTYNNTIEVLREIVRELDPTGFKDWTRLDRYWFSSELDVPELNINVRGQEGGFNFQGANLNVGGDMVSGDMVAGSKVEIKNNTINVSTRAALDPLGAQTALTESFIKALGEFVQERPAVILFEGLDHEYCSAKTRIWVDGLLDRIRVLKGFGVLPIVTYFNAPNFEARLRSVTLRAELKPLSQEHITEYFRARRIPENIIVDAAQACIEETHGIPARVYEYTENIVSALHEQITETLVQSVVVQMQEMLDQPQDVKASLQEIQAQPVESVALVEAPAPVVEPVEAIQANSPTATAMAEPSVIAEKPDHGSEPPVAREQNVAEVQAGESLPAVFPEEKTNRDGSSHAEAVLPVPEEAKANAETKPPVQETPLVELETKTVEQFETEIAKQPEAPGPAPQPVEELEPASDAQGLAQAALISADIAEPVEAEVAEPREVPQQVQPTPEEAKRIEEAFRRSQERLQQLKLEGKSSTANMVDSLLERQSNDVAELARRCAVLRWFNLDLIAVIANQELKPEQAPEILNTISSWPFVQNFGYGTYAYRREVQQYLRTQMHNENPELYLEINQRAEAYFEKQLGAADTSDEMIWVNLTTNQVTALRENLYYLLQVDTARGFHLLGKLFYSAQRLNLHSEVAILLKFANEIDLSTLGENHKNQLTYYEAVLEFAEGEAGSAESKLRELMAKPLDDELNAQVLGQLGVVCAAGRKYDEAIKFFEQAQKIWQKLKRERERARLSNNLGNVYMRKNDLNRAERSFNDALNGLKKAGTPSESALTLNNLGNVHLQKENFSKALEHYQTSLEIKTSIGDQFGAANTHSNLGTVYQRMAQDASGKKQVELRGQAADYYTRSLEAYRTFGARSNQGKLLYKLAFLYYQSGDKAKAREYLPDALNIFRDLEMPDLENASKLEKQLG